MSRKQVYLACVTAQYGCERIIRAAKCIADDAGARLEVVSVLNGGVDRRQLDTLEYLNDIARKSDAQMTVLYSDNPALTVADYIKRCRATHIIAGTAAEENSGRSDFISLIRSVLPKVHILLIPPVLSGPDEQKLQVAVEIPAVGISAVEFSTVHSVNTQANQL